MLLPSSFYRRDSVELIARELLGKRLFSRVDGCYCSGIIAETEAYAGRNDKASHARNGRRSQRTDVFFQAGGIAYVYLCYGIHEMFNVITNEAGIPDAVLIRALIPEQGLEHMRLRRGKLHLPDHQLCRGPGSLSKALGIDRRWNALPLDGEILGIEEAGISITKRQTASSARIGIAYAGPDALKPWRFYIRNCKAVSG